MPESDVQCLVGQFPSPLPIKWCTDVLFFSMPSAVLFKLSMSAPFGLESHLNPLRWEFTVEWNTPIGFPFLFQFNEYTLPIELTWSLKWISIRLCGINPDLLMTLLFVWMKTCQILFKEISLFVGALRFFCNVMWLTCMCHSNGLCYRVSEEQRHAISPWCCYDNAHLIGHHPVVTVGGGFAHHPHITGMITLTSVTKTQRSICRKISQCLMYQKWYKTLNSYKNFFF